MTTQFDITPATTSFEIPPPPPPLAFVWRSTKGKRDKASFKGWKIFRIYVCVDM